MDYQSKIPPHVLTEDEAWALFKTTAHLDDHSSDVAKMVLKQCSRLPLVIMSVGNALRDKPVGACQQAFEKLRDGECLEIQDSDIEEMAYRSLKFSFDELPREETKRCLILCSLFPKDRDVCVEDLTRYALGLRLYQHSQSIKDVSNEVLDAIRELKCSYFLLEGDTKGHVKMDRLVHDVVVLIGKRYSVVTDSKMEEKFIAGGGTGFNEWPTDERFRDYAALSFLDNEIARLPDKLPCPKLEMLLLSRRALSPEGYTSSHQECTDVPDGCIEGMEKLKILSLTRGNLSVYSLKSLTNLHILELKYCNFTLAGNSTADNSSLRNLKKLEILSFYGSEISELPNELGELENLKLLELTNCYGLDRISSNMIRKLSKLEELHVGVFEDWDVQLLLELNSLHHLDILSLAYRISFPESFVFSSLTAYHLHICDCECPRFLSRLRYPTSRIICIIATEEIVDACEELFANVYNLHIECSDTCFQNMVPDISPMGFQELHRLELYGCEMECLISTTKQQQQQVAENAFSHMVELEIGNTTLKELCDGLPPKRFLENLHTLTISYCEQMNTIFPAKLLRGVKKLESVMVEDCDNLQYVFQLEEFDQVDEQFARLTSLELKNTDKLLFIWNGPTRLVNLKSLTRLILWNCGSLISVFSPSVAQSLVHLEKLDIGGCAKLEHIITEVVDDEEPLKGHPPSYLQNLKVVQIESCNRLLYVLPISMAQDLMKLEEIIISDAAQLNQVFGNCKGPSLLSRHANDNPLLPVPRKLEIKDPYWFSRNNAVVLPSLSRVQIEKCPQLAMNSLLWALPEASRDSEQQKVSYAERIPLETLDLKGLSQLEHIIAVEDDDVEKGLSSLKTHFQAISFSSLQKLRITECNKLKILLPVEIARDLQLLTEIYVKSCNQLVAIFGNEDQAHIDAMEEITFPKLLELCLEELPNLITFGPQEYHFVFSSLECLRVETCPKMTTRFTTAAGCYHSYPIRGKRSWEELNSTLT
ncbi:probable disease resistance protein At4g27220 isoform X2 [Mercurialis annua]|uniref:probable disease resistance protein At4g27220 isoform X2 n=1 Tax=Mercurialis annua TaxID=3986 RepID=UPI0021610010|nr:probable disease resistance protein At4g27220 isoform X2 [Mercurialis annua]